MAATVNGSFTSPLANAAYPQTGGAGSEGIVSMLYNSMTALNISVSVLLILVLYDQCTRF